MGNVKNEEMSDERFKDLQSNTINVAWEMQLNKAKFSAGS